MIRVGQGDGAGDAERKKVAVFLISLVQNASNLRKTAGERKK